MPYCQYCGTKLEEGQACTCEMAQAAANPAPAQQPSVQSAPAKESQAALMVKDLKSYLKAYIADPAQAVRSAMEIHTLSTAVALSIIRLLAMGLAIYGLLRKTCSDTLSFITTSLLSYQSTSDILTVKLTASLPQSLIFGAIIAAVGMLLFVAVLFVLAKIQHENVTFLSVFKASAANGLPTTALLLLSFLLSFISTTPCLIFMVLAMLSWMICGVLTVHLVCPNGKSSAFWMMYFVGVALIVVAGYYVMPPMFLRAVGGINASYLGRTVTLQTVFDTASNRINSALAEEGVGSLGELYSKGLKEGLQELVSDFWYSMF